MSIKKIVSVVFIFIGFILCTTTYSYAQQTINAKRIIITDSMNLGSVWIKGISADTSLADSADNIIPTQSAVKGALANLHFGGGGELDSNQIRRLFHSGDNILYDSTTGIINAIVNNHGDTLQGCFSFVPWQIQYEIDSSEYVKDDGEFKKFIGKIPIDSGDLYSIKFTSFTDSIVNNPDSASKYVELKFVGLRINGFPLVDTLAISLNQIQTVVSLYNFTAISDTGEILFRYVSVNHPSEAGEGYYSPLVDSLSFGFVNYNIENISKPTIDREITICTGENLDTVYSRAQIDANFYNKTQVQNLISDSISTHPSTNIYANNGTQIDAIRKYNLNDGQLQFINDLPGNPGYPIIKLSKNNSEISSFNNEFEYSKIGTDSLGLKAKLEVNSNTTNLSQFLLDSSGVKFNNNSNDLFSINNSGKIKLNGYLNTDSDSVLTVNSNGNLIFENLSDNYYNKSQTETLISDSLNAHGGGTNIDTTSLSNRINTKLNIEDTSSLIRKTDSIGLTNYVTHNALNDSLANVASINLGNSDLVQDSTVRTYTLRNQDSALIFRSEISNRSATLGLVNAGGYFPAVTAQSIDRDNNQISAFVAIDGSLGLLSSDTLSNNRMEVGFDVESYNTFVIKHYHTYPLSFQTFFSIDSIGTISFPQQAAPTGDTLATGVNDQGKLVTFPRSSGGSGTDSIIAVDNTLIKSISENTITLKTDTSKIATLQALNDSLSNISSIDTTSLSNRINTKLNISDTSVFLRDGDVYTKNEVNENIHDSIVINKIDTTSLSNRINTKLNISDTTNKWQPKGTYLTDLNQGTGISITGSGETRTVTNTSPDQTVSLTGSNGISITGTYPNFNISGSGGTGSDSGKVYIDYGLLNINDSTIAVDSTIIAYKSWVNDIKTNLQNNIDQKLNISDTSDLARKSNTITINNNTQNVGDNPEFTIPIIDTTSLSNRINTKLNSSDTTSLSNRINTKLNITDTTNHWAPKGNYIYPSDTSVFVRDNEVYTKSQTDINIHDSIAANLINTLDTTSLSNRINTKLNITDTTNHWAPKGNYIFPSDTSDFARDEEVALKLNISDTSNLAPKNNTYNKGEVNENIHDSLATLVIPDTALFVDNTLIKSISLNNITLKVDTSKIMTISGFNDSLAANGLEVLAPLILDSVNKKLYADTSRSAKSHLATQWYVDSTNVDTTSLSNRINTKLNSSDTTSLSNRINTKLNITDTTNHWAPKGNYIYPGDTTGHWAAAGQYVHPADTTNHWAPKGNYIFPSDTSDFARDEEVALKLDKNDSTSLTGYVSHNALNDSLANINPGLDTTSFYQITAADTLIQFINAGKTLHPTQIKFNPNVIVVGRPIDDDSIKLGAATLYNSDGYQLDAFRTYNIAGGSLYFSDTTINPSYDQVLGLISRQQTHFGSNNNDGVNSTGINMVTTSSSTNYTTVSTASSNGTNLMKVGTTSIDFSHAGNNILRLNNDLSVQLPQLTSKPLLGTDEDGTIIGADSTTDYVTPKALKDSLDNHSFATSDTVDLNGVLTKGASSSIGILVGAVTATSLTVSDGGGSMTNAKVVATNGSGTLVPADSVNDYVTHQALIDSLPKTKVVIVGDNDYTVTSEDRTIILTNPSVQRTITLPTSSPEGRRLTLVVKASGPDKWVTDATGFVPIGTFGTAPFTPEQASFAAQVAIELVWDADSGMWFQINNGNG